MAAKFHQVEFLVEGNLLPLTIGKLQVSETLILEQAWSSEWVSHPTGQSKSFALAYVGVRGDPRPDFFVFARAYLDFFLLLYSLTTAQPVIQFMGVGTEIRSLSALGTHRVSFPGVEKAPLLNENMESRFSKPILSVKKRFIELEKDRQAIMDGYLGLALRYYYYGLLANARGHYDEVVIDLAIAAEAIFTTTRVDITKNLKHRLPAYIAEDELDRATIAKRVGDFYGLRSGIVHGSRRKIPLAEVRVVSDYIRRAIDKALSNRHFSKQELVEILDRST